MSFAHDRFRVTVLGVVLRANATSSSAIMRAYGRIEFVEETSGSDDAILAYAVSGLSGDASFAFGGNSPYLNSTQNPDDMTVA